jgi:hypothetical protein
MWKNYFNQLLNIYEVNDIRWTETHIVEPLTLKNSSVEVETAMEKLRRYELLGTDQIPEEMFQTEKMF